MQKIEHRSFSGELRAEGENVLVGVVVPYNAASRIGDRFTEIWLPGAIGEIGPEVRANVQHSRSAALAVHREGGGLSFTDSAYRAESADRTAPDTGRGMDTAELVRRHVLGGLSQQSLDVFRTQWRGRERTITSVELTGVGIVDEPGLLGAEVEIEARWKEIGGDEEHDDDDRAFRRRLLRWV